LQDEKRDMTVEQSGRFAAVESLTVEQSGGFAAVEN
jgi:hypothetical protein